jgi:hypothetical protein
MSSERNGQRPGVDDATGPDLLTPLNGIISPSESESKPSPNN